MQCCALEHSIAHLLRNSFTFTFPFSKSCQLQHPAALHPQQLLTFNESKGHADDIHPLLWKKALGRLPSEPPWPCQLPKSPAPSRWAVSSDWAGLVTTTPLSLLSSSCSRDLAPPLSQPQWWSLIGVEGQFYQHQDCSSPHGPIPKDFILFHIIFQSLYSGDSEQRQQWLKSHRHWPCFKQTQSSDYL